MSQHSNPAVGISPMMSSPQQPQSQQSQGSASSTGSILAATPHQQQAKSSESSDSIAKVKSLIGPLRESLGVSLLKHNCKTNSISCCFFFFLNDISHFSLFYR